MRGCKPLDPNQIQTTLTHLSARDRALFTLGIRTGFRISELLSLCIRDVWDGASVRDAVQVTSQSLKGRRPSRCIALHAEAKTALGEYLSTLPAPLPIDRALFHSRKGGALDRKSAWRILHSAFLKAGIQGVGRQLGTHCMRKTFADRVYLRLGRDLVKTQRALGHTNIQSTAQYLSFDEDEIIAAILSA